MSARLTLALWLSTVLAVSQATPAAAQADAHARAITRASCQSGQQSEVVTAAKEALAREPDEIGPRMRVADALVDQGCYQEAVAILEAGQESHPRNVELTAKLRDVRSLVTEQTYIEGLTQAAEGAKFQRNQLRCTRLADVTACDDALKFKPDDAQLQLARVEALKAKPAPTESQQANTQATPSPTPVPAVSDTAPRPRPARKAPATTIVSGAASVAAARPNAPPKPTTTPPTQVASVAAPAPVESRTYSNDAPPGRSN